VHTVNYNSGDRKIIGYHAYDYEEVVGVDQSAAQMENTTRIEWDQIDEENHRCEMPYGY
jgi:hypothetical protein